MSLSKEWFDRISQWNTKLWQLCYEPFSTFELSGFTTQEHLSPEQALKRKFTLMPVGVMWGYKWEYGWFKAEFSLPVAAAGKRIVLCMNPASKSPEDGECLVWSNGVLIGSFGWARHEVTLTVSGTPGESYSILVEAYAGHGPLLTGSGPVLHGHDSVPDVTKPQVMVGPSSYGIWHEQVYQLAVDFTTLFELREQLEKESLQVNEIDQGLKDVTLLIDLEKPSAEIIESIEDARERLHPLLNSGNRTTAPIFFSFGHAHIDVAWLWPMEETERKIARTVINQLSLMDEYPDYLFLQSQPQLYIMLKKRYPQLYGRFKKAVISGRVIPDGAMWVEADTNITGGESLIRQILYAKQFLQDEFGCDTNVMWLPDVFGYTAALPQILVNCGVTSFATQKIAWTYHGGDPFPYNTFLWQGIDGSTIPAHIFTDYNGQTRPRDLLERWKNRLQRDGIYSMLLAFGWGDGGGGPTRDHLEFLRRSSDLEGVPRLILSSPANFFEDLKLHGLPKERYVGELYFQAHRGTYTSQAKIKQGNRRSEFALREAEFWGSIAQVIKGYQFPDSAHKSNWLKLLLHQFHDILPGTSIERVNVETELAHKLVINEALEAARKAANNFIKTSPSLTLFNSLSWERTVLVDLPHGTERVTIPSCGWKSIDLNYHTEKTIQNQDSKLIASSNVLENNVLRVLFNENGEITSLIDKETGYGMLTGIGNRFILYKDVPSQFDAWDIDSMTENMPLSLKEPGWMDVIQVDRYQAAVKLERKIHNSSITQIIRIQQGSHRIDFETTIDWQESHKLLKVSFPVNIHTDEALHEIQFGYIKRPNHRSRPYDADRFEVCNHKWTALLEENRGVAILNDSKYGISVLQNDMQLTLLRAALTPDSRADNGIHKFTYSFYYWNSSFFSSRVIQEAYEMNCPVLIIPGSARESSIFQVDENNIILETVKLAEDKSGDIIIRLYEAKRTMTDCVLSTSLPVKSVCQTDMLERNQIELPVHQGKIRLDFRPFEIKTLRLMMENRKSGG